MPFTPARGHDDSQLPFKTKNKLKRHDNYLKIKKSKESSKRDARFKRKREEDKNPRLREQRRARNIPQSIDRKRVWDEVEDEDQGTGLGLSVDLTAVKKQKTDQEPEAQGDDGEGLTENNLKQVEKQTSASNGRVSGGEGEEEISDNDSEEDDLASLMEDSEAASENGSSDEDDLESKNVKSRTSRTRDGSPTAASTTSTNLSFFPDALAAKFPSLFKPAETPKILITTSLGGTVHHEAGRLTEFFPNSDYIPRQRHRYKSHHYSLREISKYAANRDYTTLMVLEEDQKRPSGLTVIHLPSGPTFHFSLKNWIEGKKLPGHGNPTEHYPELILNNFRTPLGILTATLFKTMFPTVPEFGGRQVVTLHNQRDYVFVRRHRYIFRDKRPNEKPATGPDGKPMQGVEDVKAGLQELGPRFTLKLRRVDKGIQRASGQEWEWKAGMEKERTKFQL